LGELQLTKENREEEAEEEISCWQIENTLVVVGKQGFGGGKKVVSHGVVSGEREGGGGRGRDEHLFLS